MSRIIIALDFDDSEKALGFARIIRNHVDWVKVGLELFTRAGPDIVPRLKEMGFRVFIDLKLFDIPNTVYGAVSSSIDAGADMLTLHTLGGKNMIHAALRARDQAGLKSDKTRLIGVTLLTSMSREDLPWQEHRGMSAIVCDLARKAHSWGLDGCVCSGLESSLIKEHIPRDFILVTPGIRPHLSDDDQKRSVTPKQACKAGADFLVIGRPVTNNPDPVQALRDIKSSIE